MVTTKNELLAHVIEDIWDKKRMLVYADFVEDGGDEFADYARFLRTCNYPHVLCTQADWLAFGPRLYRDVPFTTYESHGVCEIGVGITDVPHGWALTDYEGWTIGYGDESLRDRYAQYEIGLDHELFVLLRHGVTPVYPRNIRVYAWDHYRAIDLSNACRQYARTWSVRMKGGVNVDVPE